MLSLIKMPGDEMRVKERRHYTEDCLQDEEIEGRRMFSVEDKLASDQFGSYFVKEMKGEDFSLKYLQEHGFEVPIVFKEKSGLGMRMPSSNFTVNDVRQCVGSRRILDVMDVTTQKDIEMTMKDWCRYYENPNREKLLNVISLEFSHTRLENYVESPTVVRLIDWVDWVWPRHLKESQTEGTNVIEDMKYPKVQKYCLMSVKGCYTDFHIDFGGTSVWYHILKGQKVFWLIPPTEHNLQLYEQWVLSGKQGDVFFGDTVEKCARVHLFAGYTFFIPTGWIHAVFTPEDTLVFGGNFLHSFGIEKQLRIAEVEDITHVPLKFRYPFYMEMLWYVLQRYVQCVIGKSHLLCTEDGEPIEPDTSLLNGFKPEKLLPSPLAKLTAPINPLPNLSLSDVNSELKLFGCAGKLPSSLEPKPQLMKVGVESPKFPTVINSRRIPTEMENTFRSAVPRLPLKLTNGNASGSGEIEEEHSKCNPRAPSLPQRPYIHLTKYELNGLKAILRWLQQLPVNKRYVPDLIRNPDHLLTDVKMLLHEHRNDDEKLAITGKPVLFWSESSKKPRPKPRTGIPTSSKQSKGNNAKGSNGKDGAGSSRRRRTRCKKCEACLRADCGECHFCKDMKKFGGPGRMKQSCISRQCMAPILPHTACCTICGRDGWEKVSNPQEHENSSLMECSQCWEIVHPTCLKERFPDLPTDGLIVNDDLPNSWECPKCCRDGKPEQIKPRQMKGGRQKPSESRRPSLTGSENGIGIEGAPPIFEVTEGIIERVKIEENINSAAAVSMSTVAVKIEPNPRIEESEQTGPGSVRKKIKTDDFIVKEEENEDNQNQNIIDNKYSLNSELHSSLITIPRDKEEDDNSNGSSPKDKKATLDPLQLRRIQSASSHVRSCARYTVSIKKPLKTEHGKIMPTKTVNKPMLSKQNELELRPRTSRLNPGVASRRHGETARERLFRSLKGLKKNSELRRHSLLRMKARTLGDIGNTKQDDKKDLTKTCIKLDRSEGDGIPKKIKNANENNVLDNGKGLQGTCAPIDKVLKGDTTGPGDKPPSQQKFSIPLRNNTNLRKPKYVVRPAPIIEESAEEKQKLSRTGTINLALEKEVMFPVFCYLSSSDLYICQLVCKTWNRWSVDPRLWTHMDLTRRKITANVLIGIVRRQPISLNLSWTNVSRRQISWLIARLPQMKELILSGCSSAAVSALCTCNCPLIRCLDLSWVEGLTDSVIRDLLAPPPDSRPGFVETKTRLRQLVEVRLAGADISDVSVRLLAHHLPSLSRLDFSHCHKVTDMGIAVLGAAKSSRLMVLDVSSCSNITDTSLEALKRCTNLTCLDMRDCMQVTEAACQKFISQSRQMLVFREGKLLQRHN